MEDEVDDVDHKQVKQETGSASYGGSEYMVVERIAVKQETDSASSHGVNVEKD